MKVGITEVEQVANDLQEQERQKRLDADKRERLYRAFIDVGNDHKKAYAGAMENLHDAPEALKNAPSDEHYKLCLKIAEAAIDKTLSLLDTDLQTKKATRRALVRKLESEPPGVELKSLAWQFAKEADLELDIEALTDQFWKSLTGRSKRIERKITTIIVDDEASV